MVELLLADDSLVRYVAIAGLTQLTGDSRGYRFFDPPEVRYQAVLSWRDYALTAQKAGTLQIDPPPAGSTTTSKAVQG